MGEIKAERRTDFFVPTRPPTKEIEQICEVVQRFHGALKHKE